MMARLISALILAGGKATRLGGIAKHELVVEGETIFARQVRVLAPRVTEILVSGATVDGHRTVRDAVEGAGPLAGIAAGLAACTTDWLLVVAGDMPFIDGGLIDTMIARTEIGSDPILLSGAGMGSDPICDAVGVMSRGLPEPLLCVLHRRVLPVLERRIAAGRYKASGLFTDEGLRVAWADAEPAAIRNLNSPDDLARITGSK